MNRYPKHLRKVLSQKMETKIFRKKKSEGNSGVQKENFKTNLYSYSQRHKRRDLTSKQEPDVLKKEYSED